MEFGNPHRAIVVWAECTQSGECHGSRWKGGRLFQESKGVAVRGLWRCVHTWGPSRSQATGSSHMDEAELHVLMHFLLAADIQEWKLFC